MNRTDLAGKVAVITGASRGIGKATALCLASRGCSILGTCSSEGVESSLQATLWLVGKRLTSAASLHHFETLSSYVKDQYSRSGRDKPPQVIGIAADIYSADCATTICDAIAKHFSSHVDIFVNNAAASGLTSIGSLTSANIQESLLGNVTTPALIVDEMVRLKFFQANSRIIYISSIRSRLPWQHQIMYSAGKAAGESLCRTWAEAFGGRHEEFVFMAGTTANAISVGLTQTESVMSVPEDTLQAFKDEFMPHQCLPRFGQPEDVAEVDNDLRLSGRRVSTSRVKQQSAEKIGACDNTFVHNIYIPNYQKKTMHSCGLVLAHEPTGRPSGVSVQNADGKVDAQRWTIEYSDDRDVIAIRNCSDGEYLHANGPKSWATVGTGTKQWWKISSDNVMPPSACSLSPVEYSGVFLNHFQGQRHSPMKVHMWQWEQPNQFCLTWYFMEAGVGFNPQGKISAEDPQAKENEAKLKELKEREAALNSKEKDLAANGDSNAAKLKEIEQREAALAEREKNATEGSDNSAPNAKGDEQTKLAKPQKGSERSVEDAGKTKDLDQPTKTPVSKGEDKQKTAEPVPPPQTSDVPSLDLLKLENENLKLQLKIEMLKAELDGAKRSTPTAASNGARIIGDAVAKPEGRNVLPKSNDEQQTRPKAAAPKAGNGVASKAEAKQGPNAKLNGVPAAKGPSKGATAPPSERSNGTSQQSLTSKAPKTDGTTSKPTKDNTSALQNPQPQSANTSKSRSQPAGSRGPAVNGDAGSLPDSYPRGVRPEPAAGSSKAMNKQSTPNSTAARKSAGSANGVPKSHHVPEEEPAVRFRCGHVAYPLPRKIERKVIGILYE